MGPLDDLLHEYEPDLISSGDARLRKIFELRQAIQDGQYDVDGEWGRLMDNMKDLMSGQRPDSDDD